MNQVAHEPLHLTSEELAILSELLETAHTAGDSCSRGRES
jgi:hypothetical protein